MSLARANAKSGVGVDSCVHAGDKDEVPRGWRLQATILKSARITFRRLGDVVLESTHCSGGGMCEMGLWRLRESIVLSIRENKNEGKFGGWGNLKYLSQRQSEHCS